MPLIGVKKHDYEPRRVLAGMAPICVCGNPKFQPWQHTNLTGRQCKAEGVGSRCQLPANHAGDHVWTSSNGYWGSWSNFRRFKTAVKGGNAT